MVALKASAPARHSTVERLRTLADEVEKLPHVHLRRAQGGLVDELPERPDGFSMGTFLERQPELGIVADIGGVAACLWGLQGGGAVDPVSQVLHHLGLGVMEGMSLMAPAGRCARAARHGDRGADAAGGVPRLPAPGLAHRGGGEGRDGEPVAAPRRAHPRAVEVSR